MSGVPTDIDFMARALQLAERGRGRTSPNPLVGAVVVSPEGVVVGQGYHERAGEAHAEVNAIEAAGAATHGATLYCTLEPCSHVGRTGPCTQRIVTAGIVRVVASVQRSESGCQRARIRAISARTACAWKSDWGWNRRLV